MSEPLEKCLLLLLLVLTANGLVGLWSFNALLTGTTLSSSTNGSVIKRGATPCSVPSSPGVPPCPDAWLTGNGTAGVDGLLAGKYGKGINVAPGLGNWGELHWAHRGGRWRYTQGK